MPETPRYPLDPNGYVPGISRFILKQSPGESYYCVLISTTPASDIENLVQKLEEAGFTVTQDSRGPSLKISVS